MKHKHSYRPSIKSIIKDSMKPNNCTRFNTTFCVWLDTSTSEGVITRKIDDLFGLVPAKLSLGAK